MSALQHDNYSAPLPENSGRQKHKAVGYWLLLGCLLICIMVWLGGITRITQSGLSITDWKITGSLPPLNDAEWETEFSRYQQFPEYKLVNRSFSVEQFKNIYWWEYIHRLIGRLTGIVFIIPFTWFILKQKLPQGFLPKGLLLLFLGASQGALGWIMVKSGLNHAPHVSHYLLAAHFALALTTLGFTFWFALTILAPQQEKSCISKLKKWSVTILALTGVQLIYGALLAGLKGGLLYPTFPQMGEHWIAPEIFSRHPVWLNFLQDGAGVQFVHRVLGTATLAAIAIFFFRMKKFPVTGLLRNGIRGTIILVSVQFLLGVLTLVNGVPRALAFTHQGGALLLFLFCVFVTHRAFHHKPYVMA